MLKNLKEEESFKKSLQKDQSMIDSLLQKTSFLELEKKGGDDDDEEEDEDDDNDDDEEEDMDDIDSVHKKYLSL
jgi:hypothetical protein